MLSVYAPSGSPGFATRSDRQLVPGAALPRRQSEPSHSSRLPFVVLRNSVPTTGLAGRCAATTTPLPPPADAHVTCPCASKPVTTSPAAHDCAAIPAPVAPAG